MTDTKYDIYDDVPLLDEHTLVDPETGKKVKIDKAFLERVADNMNKRIAETGDLSPIIIGHTVDGLEETKQPLIQGYACKYTVKKLLNSARYAVHGRFKLEKSKKDQWSKYPRRSVEFWPGRLEIDPIALLGATTPERNLGILKYERSNAFHYKREVNEMDNDKDRDDQGTPPGAPPDKTKTNSGCLTAADLDQMDWVQFAKELMSVVEQGGDLGSAEQAAGGAAGPGGPPGASPPGAPPGPAGAPPGAGPQMPPPPQPQKFAAGMPGAGSVSPPQFGGKKPQQYSRATADNTQDDPIDPFTEGLLKELTDLKIKFAATERKQKLADLRDKEGCDIDVDAELADISDLNDTQFEKHLGRIKTRYARNPARPANVWQYQRQTPNTPVNGPSKPMTKEQAMARVKIATERGIPWEQAGEVELKNMGLERVD